MDNSLLAPNGFICLGSPTESFVADDNQSEEEDDEYFIFAGKGIAIVVDALLPYMYCTKTARPI